MTRTAFLPAYPAKAGRGTQPTCPWNLDTPFFLSYFGLQPFKQTRRKTILVSMTVPFFDLKPQFGSIEKEIKDALEEVYHTQQFILGPQVQKWFKKRYKLDFRYDTYGLRLCKNDTNKFLKMVKPVFDKFKLPISLNYKLGKDLVRRDNQHKNRMEYQNTERIKKREEFLKEHKQNCLECDKEFPLTRTDKKFCSRKCKNKFNFHKFVLKQKKVKK
jgi:hypothetical protein